MSARRGEGCTTLCSFADYLSFDVRQPSVEYLTLPVLPSPPRPPHADLPTQPLLSTPGPMLLYAEFLWRVRQDKEGAADMYHAACEAAPKFADAHAVCGQFLLEAGDKDGAVKAMRLAVSLAPPTGKAGAALWYNLGHVLQLLASDGTPGKKPRFFAAHSVTARLAYNLYGRTAKFCRNMTVQQAATRERRTARFWH